MPFGETFMQHNRISLIDNSDEKKKDEKRIPLTILPRFTGAVEDKIQENKRWKKYILSIPTLLLKTEKMIPKEVYVMRFFTIFFRTLIVFVFFCCIFPQNVYAYLDAGTGAYVIQILVAIFVGGVVALKLFWGNIKILFKKLFTKKGEEETKE